MSFVKLIDHNAVKLIYEQILYRHHFISIVSRCREYLLISITILNFDRLYHFNRRNEVNVGQMYAQRNKISFTNDSQSHDLTISHSIFRQLHDSTLNAKRKINRIDHFSIKINSTVYIRFVFDFFHFVHRKPFRIENKATLDTQTQNDDDTHDEITF